MTTNNFCLSDHWLGLQRTHALYFFAVEEQLFLSASWIWVNRNKQYSINLTKFRNSHPEAFLREGVLEICSKFTGKYPCRSVISIKLQSMPKCKLQNNLVEIALRHGYCPVNLLHIFRTPFLGTPLGGCFWKFLFYLFSMSLFNLAPWFFFCWWFLLKSITKNNKIL